MKNTKLPEICIYLYKNEKTAGMGKNIYYNVIIWFTGENKIATFMIDIIQFLFNTVRKKIKHSESFQFIGV